MTDKYNELYLIAQKFNASQPRSGMPWFHAIVTVDNYAFDIQEKICAPYIRDLGDKPLHTNALLSALFPNEYRNNKISVGVLEIMGDFESYSIYPLNEFRS